MYKYFFKRLLDILISISVLIIFSPIFIMVLICLFIANNGKPFFFQERPGKDEKLFRIIKFKTMNDKKDDYGNLLPDAQRLTKVGSFVRKTSLDELPQLINVFIGDMSLIGPRPLLIRYLPYYKQEERLRHSVRPGITGWAQVNGRNTVKWDDRLALDVVYVKNFSFMMDVKIIWKTIMKVIKSENIVVDPESIMKNLDDERRD
ncbi:sugar transferase [Elizabethkingia meningoseptica]|uniref:sugar transferase n=1 Tax=Elizabethkingia meningoseptica TaxID=238 RepID=UPI0022F1AF71|nr:sugar transferase [Elizabethkingia meningoseptica]EJK5329517.1 sugar transferase [Elizabethkingia meningoseptica]MDE5430537.1 sugar transferase [Elizabethkingia meningoseptica]MDE5469357.1 sugar transferase [Elizabethkingia meningoseptica]MDE5475271.1 sugar transferase [Elizabethkingia meningoseptica]MDE5478704.1 sugar transferase [Elizabethkingia meningoseptica]